MKAGTRAVSPSFSRPAAGTVGTQPCLCRPSVCGSLLVLEAPVGRVGHWEWVLLWWRTCPFSGEHTNKML